MVFSIGHGDVHKAGPHAFGASVYQQSMPTRQSWLFPPSQIYLSGFTTSPYVIMPQITHVALSDSALGVTKVTAGTDHPVVQGPRSKSNAWQATYPKDSYTPSSGSVNGGFGFYLAVIEISFLP